MLSKVIAVIVLYHPEKDVFAGVVDSIISQVEKLILVDNSEESADESLFFANEKVEYIALNKNHGIACAQNIGIKKALEFGADWILLSDQDTVYPQNYIRNMFRSLENGDLKTKQIGALVPIVFDEVTGHKLRIMATKTKSVPPPDSGICRVAHAVASGTLIPKHALEKVGLMREDFFIDFVDHEWCWRAFANGLHTYCLANVVIHHHLGDSVEKRFGLKIVYRSPFRFYYIIRNGYYLLYHTNYLKGRDRILFWLLMKKKIMEVLALNYFDKKSRAIVKYAVRNGKRGIFANYEETIK